VRRSNELYNFHTDHELEQKLCELRFATIKNLWTLSSGKKTKFRLTFYQDTRMSGRGVQTPNQGICVQIKAFGNSPGRTATEKQGLLLSNTLSGYQPYSN